MRHTYYQPHGRMRAEMLNVDRVLREVSRDFALRRLSLTEAIERCREAGACEPEIREALAA